MVLSLFSAPLFVLPALTAHREPGGAKVPPSHQVSWGMGLLLQGLQMHSDLTALGVLVWTPALQALH